VVVIRSKDMSLRQTNRDLFTTGDLSLFYRRLVGVLWPDSSHRNLR